MKLSTICVQGAYRPKNGEPRVVPIVQSTTYKYDSSVEMGDLFDLKKSGYFYSRLQNPTCDTVAAKIAMLEGGVARRPTFTPSLTLPAPVTTLSALPPFTAAPTICLM